MPNESEPKSPPSKKHRLTYEEKKYVKQTRIKLGHILTDYPEFLQMQRYDQYIEQC